MARESERYNLSNIGTLDQPLLAVGFLQSRYVNRFRYTVGEVEKYAGAYVRYVAFRESARPTIIRTSGIIATSPRAATFSSKNRRAASCAARSISAKESRRRASSRRSDLTKTCG